MKPDSRCGLKESGKLPESTPHLERIVGVSQPKTQWYRKQSPIYSTGGLVAHESEISTLGGAITRNISYFCLSWVSDILHLKEF